MRPVYLDHNATTPLAPEVRAAMEPYLEGQFGNPLTAHVFGATPRAAVEAARDDVAALVGARAADCDVIFNSGATEGLNHALKGIAFRTLVAGRAGARRRIVIGGLEHAAVTRSADWLAATFGFDVVAVAAGRDGVTRADRFAAAVQGGDVAVAALQFANNEVGAVQPVREVGRACRDAGVPLVCDAVQSAGKLDLAGAFEWADAWAFSAHKFHGPKGVGALVLRKGLDVDTFVHGASQEVGRRGGTHNVAGIVGLAAAARWAKESLPSEAPRLAILRDLFWTELHAKVEGVAWNGHGAPLLPNTLNVSFEGCPSQALCDAMDKRGVAVSAGAACRSGDPKPSAAVLAMTSSESRALTSVRISLGLETTRHDVIAATSAFADAVARVRAAL